MTLEGPLSQSITSNLLNVQLPILDAPGKWDLMLGLFDGSWAIGSHRKLKFAVERIGNVELSIKKVGAEDDSGESWSIEGYGPKIHGMSWRTVFNGCLDTRTRTGHITFKSQ